MTTPDYFVSTISSGLASLDVIVDGERECVATLERNECRGIGITPYDEWFATPSPSHADAMAHQYDRLPYAVAWGRTPCGCAESFLATYYAA